MICQRPRGAWCWLLIPLLLLLAGPHAANLLAGTSGVRGARADAGASHAAARSAAALHPLPAPPAGGAAAAPLVCVVVRTYWGHGSYGDNALPELLASLARQTHAR